MGKSYLPAVPTSGRRFIPPGGRSPVAYVALRGRDFQRAPEGRYSGTPPVGWQTNTTSDRAGLLVERAIASRGERLDASIAVAMGSGMAAAGVRATESAQIPVPGHSVLSVSDPSDGREQEAQAVADRFAALPSVSALAPKGYDFSEVSVHADAAAAESARNLGAVAYTVGSHLVFGQDAYQPHTPRGRWILAHELTHVLQEAGTTRPTRIVTTQPVSGPTTLGSQAPVGVQSRMSRSMARQPCLAPV
jgi:Domain of unknown function (DUF4157)